MGGPEGMVRCRVKQHGAEGDAAQSLSAAGGLLQAADQSAVSAPASKGFATCLQGCCRCHVPRTGPTAGVSPIAVPTLFFASLRMSATVAGLSLVCNSKQANRHCIVNVQRCRQRGGGCAGCWELTASQILVRTGPCCNTLACCCLHFSPTHHWVRLEVSSGSAAGPGTRIQPRG
jgi:hypothetical protein